MTALTLFDLSAQVRESVNQIDPETGVQKQRTRIDMTGKIYGELYVMSFSHLDTKKNAHWLVRCSCGNVKTANGYDIRAGKTISCGHIKSSRGAANQYKHGHAGRGAHTKTYTAWRNMLDRCKNDKNYAGRGINVCHRWIESYENFLADMGEIADGMSLERVDVNGDYSPSNCTLIPRADQVHNRRKTVRVTIDGESVPLAIACKEVGVSYTAAIQRMKRSLPTEQVLFKGRL